MLIKKLSKCSVNIKCYLYKTYCSTRYCSALGFNSIKTALTKLKIAYNNYSLRRLFGLPKCNSASEMFVNLRIPLFDQWLRKLFFSFNFSVSQLMSVEYMYIQL